MYIVDSNVRLCFKMFLKKVDFPLPDAPKLINLKCLGNFNVFFSNVISIPLHNLLSNIYYTESLIMVPLAVILIVACCIRTTNMTIGSVDTLVSSTESR